MLAPCRSRSTRGPWSTRSAGKEQSWHVTGRHGRASLAVQLHDPAGALVLLPAADLAVAVWRDLDNSQLTLATAWNVTNTLILGSFVIAAMREARAHRTARA